MKRRRALIETEGWMPFSWDELLWLDAIGIPVIVLVAAGTMLFGWPDWLLLLLAIVSAIGIYSVVVFRVWRQARRERQERRQAEVRKLASPPYPPDRRAAA
jgi:hypothetical protein